MSGAFSAHPLLVLGMGLMAPLLACEHRFRRLRTQGWRLPALGLALSGATALLGRVDALAGPAPAGLELAPWLVARLLGLYLTLLVVVRLSSRASANLTGWLTLVPVPLFWGLIDISGGRVPGAWGCAATGAVAFLLLAAWTGAQEKHRQNAAPPGLDGLPFRLLALALILVLQLGLEALLAGRLP